MFQFICSIRQEYLTLLHAKNKGANQPVHTNSLTSIIFKCNLKSILVQLASCKSSMFYLVSTAEQVALGFAGSDTLKTGNVASSSIWHSALTLRAGKFFVSNRLDPDQTHSIDGPNLGSICLQCLLPGNKSPD